MELKEVLGLDIGGARTGVARASMVARIAEPVAVVETDKLFDYLEYCIEKQSVDAVIVGLPRNLQGEETEQTEWVRRWVSEAKSSLKTTFYWQDEALTSRLAEAQKKAGKRPRDTDALAAAIILQDFLDTPEADRVVC